MRLILAGAAALLLCAQSSARAQDKKDPKKPDNTQVTEILGKTLEQWVKEIESADPSRRAQAIHMAVLFGPERAYQAMPAILKELGKHTASYPIDLTVRLNAAVALGIILDPQNNKDPEPKHVKEAVKLLTRLLTDSQAVVKYRAVQALGRIGVDAKDAIPNILPLVKDGATWETRQGAVEALGRVAIDKEKGPPSNVFLAIYGALGDKASQVRLTAIQSLTFLGGPADPKFKQDLIKNIMPLASKDPEAQVQIWANMAIMSIMHEVTPDRIGPVIGFLDNSDAQTRVQAAQALGTIGTKAKSGIPKLMEHLADRDPVVIGWCIWALGRMEDNAAKAVPMLEQIIGDTSQPEALKQAATKAIDQIKGKAKKAEK